MNMSTTEAQIELAILDSQAQDLDRLDVLTRYTNAGMPQEIVQRLLHLLDARAEIGNRVIHVGRIAIYEIDRFVDANPNMAIGLALGAAVGALTTVIPFVGPLLTALSVAIGALIGGLAGRRLDDGQKPGQGVIGIAQEVIIVARKFFQLLASIFHALGSPVLGAAQ